MPSLVGVVNGPLRLLGLGAVRAAVLPTPAMSLARAASPLTRLARAPAMPRPCTNQNRLHWGILPNTFTRRMSRSNARLVCCVSSACSVLQKRQDLAHLLLERAHLLLELCDVCSLVCHINVPALVLSGAPG